ncbi:pyridoxine 5'-phosphate synthase [Roseococcus sp. SYP-B2431]|uniref:pyridoxine 5'-phosphate synthase n=1 Tax=Roseococcus sp. SYP-B2431 TaxID=2496640 RepID=UPI00103B6B55|nr:pyridoxine 5'-phosphate synthase [Roseococcus sp. SYP-B2431]TCH98802.1 pyridoxine 5'-phosphate synthase [Roseococcus sp. SYP-B2431]
MRLSVNVDHVATLRNARGGAFPCPVEAARVAMAAGADGVTMHLREDRRHIRDRDLERVASEVETRLNFEMAATEEMVALCERLHPPACCIVPEKREELTTEGGLDALRAGPFLAEAIRRLSGLGIEVSLFVEPDALQIARAAELGAQAIELHTGTYAEAPAGARAALAAKHAEAAVLAKSLGLQCHAGHGLSYETIAPIAAIPEISEVSIGHFLISTSVFEGLPTAIARMKGLIAAARG